MMQGSDVERRIEELKAWDRAALVAEWERVQGQPPPKHSSPQFMMRVIAYHWQEEVYGGLPAGVKRQIAVLMKQYKENPSALLVARPQIKAGIVLRRLWQGRMHEVMVVQDGFSYQEKIYQTLSEVAGVITGGKWNGYAFFGLRKRKGNKK